MFLRYFSSVNYESQSNANTSFIEIIIVFPSKKTEMQPVLM